MKIFTKVMAIVVLGFAATAANAIVFVPGGGTSGPQSSAFQFNGFDGSTTVTMTIGVSNATDGAFGPNQNNVSFGGLLAGQADVSLIGDVGVDTSAYTNFFGEAGTTGDLVSFDFNPLDGETVTWDWEYFSNDGGQFHDFSFVDFSIDGSSVAYFVLAQDCELYVGPKDCNDPTGASEPGILVLMGLG
ncbi:MAG: hypothetical protein HKN49_09240, partial [Gammaproteobacteria bacterium]|nr:hypothetical protein [Gammaproteobacteria bacterium]